MHLNPLNSITEIPLDKVTSPSHTPTSVCCVQCRWRASCAALLLVFFLCDNADLVPGCAALTAGLLPPGRRQRLDRDAHGPGQLRYAPTRTEYDVRY
eukprot:2661222-Rhodomonas_salina.2